MLPTVAGAYCVTATGCGTCPTTVTRRHGRTSCPRRPRRPRRRGQGFRVDQTPPDAEGLVQARPAVHRQQEPGETLRRGQAGRTPRRLPDQRRPMPQTGRHVRAAEGRLDEELLVAAVPNG